MNVKFKKLAMQAGITAALAGASLSAHAVITAVPAPAQLVPLFMWANPGSSNTTIIDTEVRVIVPRAVGTDTVIDLLGGTLDPTRTSVNASWNATQAGLTTAASVTSRIHWFFMDVRSREVVNSSFPVTPDDEIYFSAASMPCQVGVGVGANCGANGVAAPTIPSQPGYLIMVNESAYLGGAPSFSFSAEAWLANEGADNIPNVSPPNGLPTAAVIPVLGMADTADTTTFPTPTNNVIENYAPAGAEGPIASPIHTGMRTSTTLANAEYRVIDIPMQPSIVTGQTIPAAGAYVNTIVAWADRNHAAAVANPPTPEIVNGLQGRMFTVNNQEVMTSNGRLTLPNQLNIVPVVPGGAPAAGYPFGNFYTQVLGNVTGAALAGGGFLKFVIDTVDLPADWTSVGSYSSVVIFTVPAQIGQNGLPIGNADDDAELAIDTGFFSAN